jgi:DNA-binding MarR family transcriptional regulator
MRSAAQHLALNLWRAATVESVRRDGPDLTARQMAILLTVYMTPQPHTVRGLSDLLKVSKPAVTRALDRLGTLGFVRRKVDEEDRRSVLVQRTVRGSVYLSEFAEIIKSAEDEVATATDTSENSDDDATGME